MIVFNITPTFLVISEHEDDEMITRMIKRENILEITIKEPDDQNESEITLTISNVGDDIELSPTREELEQARHIIGQL